MENISFQELFEKKFNFSKVDDWHLSFNFSDENIQWDANCLTNVKQELNATKSCLNDKGEDWHAHTSLINKAAYVINAIKSKITPELITQAWCKFYEILCSYNLFETGKPSIRSLHLCEVPGAFISALNYYLCANHPNINWQWMANSLNPYYEGYSMRNVVVDDRLLFPTLKNWYFGTDNTGDITNPDYIDDLCNKAKEVGLFDLVTADGSFDCLSNPGEQESIVAELQFVEVLIALSSLLPGGCFVLKKYTFFECITVYQLYILNCVFEKVHVFKPLTSKSSNSEVYVICIGFHPSEILSNILDHHKHAYRLKKIMPVYPESEIPQSFLKQVENCSKYFADLQINSIKENISLFPIQDKEVIRKIDELKKSCAQSFLQKYSVQPCALYDACKLYSTKKRVVTSFYDKTKKDHKSIYFQAVGGTFNNMQKFSSLTWQEKLLDVENRINGLFPIEKKRVHEEVEWVYPWKEIRKRMKSKNFQNWITMGKKISCIQNSKFCYPVILYLWNQVAHSSEVDIHAHISSLCYWPLEDLIDVLRDESSSDVILSLSPSGSDHEKDALLHSLENDYNFEVIYSEGNESHNILSAEEKIVYINMTWGNSLHQECLIKNRIVEEILTAIKILKKGDDFMLCIQSLLTRYTVGLIFIVLSLFEKFTTVVPEDSAPAHLGQIWIFKNFLEPKYLNNIIELLSTIKQLNSSATKEVLEVIPMTSLCGGLFHIYLRNINNKHFLQRLRSFISVEKCRIQKSKVSPK